MRIYDHVTDLIEVHIQARRIFRLGTVPALALAVAYAIQLPLPFIAPLFAFMFAAMPGPPMGPKSLFGLVLVILISLGLGLLLIPLLLHYQFTAILLVAVGLYFSSYLTVNMGKALLGTFLTIGFLNGFLPCGLVYMAVFTAIATGNALQGSLYMFIFGLGTIPLMTSAIYFSQFLKGNARQRIQKIIPVFVIIIGALFIIRGLGLGIPYLSPSPVYDIANAAMDCNV